MQRKRRQFLVEKRVQGALGVRIALHWLVFLSLSVTVTCVLRMPGKLEYPTLWAGLQAALLEQLASITVLLALLPWFIHDSLKLSNRFAGPMLRLKKAIVQLTNEQEAPPVIFRSGDFWLELADDFNELRGRVLAERALLAEKQQEVSPPFPVAAVTPVPTISPTAATPT